MLLLHFVISNERNITSTHHLSFSLQSSKVTINLIGPSGIVLDGDQHLFIVDCENHRLIDSNKYDFHCIFGCFGSTNDKLTNPLNMSFDN